MCHFQPLVEADDEEEDRDEEENAKDRDEVRGNQTLLLWGFNPGNVNFEFIPNKSEKYLLFSYLLSPSSESPRSDVSLSRCP